MGFPRVIFTLMIWHLYAFNSNNHCFYKRTEVKETVFIYIYIYLRNTCEKGNPCYIIWERKKKNEHKDVKRKLKKCPRFTNTK